MPKLSTSTVKDIAKPKSKAGTISAGAGQINYRNTQFAYVTDAAPLSFKRHERP